MYDLPVLFLPMPKVILLLYSFSVQLCFHKQPFFTFATYFFVREPVQGIKSKSITYSHYGFSVLCRIQSLRDVLGAVF